MELCRCGRQIISLLRNVSFCLLEHFSMILSLVELLSDRNISVHSCSSSSWGFVGHFFQSLWRRYVLVRLLPSRLILIVLIPLLLYLDWLSCFLSWLLWIEQINKFTPYSLLTTFLSRLLHVLRSIATIGNVRLLPRWRILSLNRVKINICGHCCVFLFLISPDWRLLFLAHLSGGGG